MMPLIRRPVEPEATSWSTWAGDRAGGAGGDRLNGEARVDGTDAGKDGPVADPEVLKVVGAAVRIDHGCGGVGAHAAGAEQVVVAVVDELADGAGGIHDAGPVGFRGFDERTVVVAV